MVGTVPTKAVAESGNLLKRCKCRYCQPAGMNLPPIVVNDDKGERFEIAAEELFSQFNREIQSWDLSFEGEVRSNFVAGLHVSVSGAKRSSTACMRSWTSLGLSWRSKASGRSIRAPAAFTSRTGPMVRQRFRLWSGN